MNFEQARVAAALKQVDQAIQEVRDAVAAGVLPAGVLADLEDQEEGQAQAASACLMRSGI